MVTSQHGPETTTVILQLLITTLILVNQLVVINIVEVLGLRCYYHPIKDKA